MKNLFIVLVSLFFIFLSEAIGQNFWAQTPGPHYGSPNNIVINSRGDIFTTSGSGVERSVDNGDSWSTVLSTGPYGCITIDADDKIYVGLSIGVYFSTDNGETWTSTRWIDGSASLLRATSITNNSDGDIFLSAGSSFYYGDKNGVYHSIDGGETWEHKGLAGKDIFSLCIEKNGDVLAGAQGVIYRSRDEGVTWERLVDYYYFGGEVRSISIDSQGIIIAGIRINSMDGNFFLSADNGTTWQEKVFPGSPSINDITIDTNNTILAATSNGLWKSSDSGETWLEIGQDLPNSWVASIAISQNGSLYAGADGVHRSQDYGLSWTQTSLPNGTFRALAAHPDGYIFGGNFRYTIEDSNWDGMAIVGGVSSIVVGSSGDVFAAGWTISRSSDTGTTWTNIPLVDLPTRVDVKALAIHPNGDLYAGSYGSGLFRSDNKGDTWILTDSAQANHPFIRSLTIDSNGFIFAGTYYDGLYRSKDDGRSWSQINNGLSDTDITVEAIGINSSGALFAGSWDGGVYKSENDGDTWLQTASPRYVFTLVVDANDNIYIGTLEDGIHRSIDGGFSWHPLNTGLDAEPVLALTIDHDGYMFAGVEKHGLYRSNHSILETIIFYMYPGDTNNNGRVGLDDLSSLEQYIGTTGPSRNVETNEWMSQPQTALWVPFDAFYADSDGNGKVEGIDVVAIIENWLAIQNEVVVPSIEKKMVCEQLLVELDNASVSSAGAEIKHAIYKYMEESLGVTFDYRLHQNYPNPFNQSTSIRFDLPLDANTVSFQIYDIAGRLVWADEITGLKPGDNEITWSGQNQTGQRLASGLYFYTVSTVSHSMVKRMVLLK